MIALIFGIFYCVVVMGISIDSLMFIILPIMKNSAPWVNHLLFWPSLAVSVAIGRETFYWVIRFLCVEDKKTQEVSK